MGLGGQETEDVGKDRAVLNLEDEKFDNDAKRRRKALERICRRE